MASLNVTMPTLHDGAHRSGSPDDIAIPALLDGTPVDPLLVLLALPLPHRKERKEVPLLPMSPLLLEEEL